MLQQQPAGTGDITDQMHVYQHTMVCQIRPKCYWRMITSHCNTLDPWRTPSSGMWRHQQRFGRYFMIRGLLANMCFWSIKLKGIVKVHLKRKNKKKQTPPLWPGRSWEAASHGGTCTCSHPSPASIDKDMIDSTESQWFPVPQQDPEVREKRSADVHGTGWNEVSNK